VTPLPWHPAYEPGLRMIGDEQCLVTDRELQFVDTGGNIIRREANGGPAEILIPAPRGGPSFEAYDHAKRVAPPPAKDTDDNLLETYLRRGGITGIREKQARDIWHTFKTVVNKPLKQCTRKDGEAIVADMAAGKAKSATLRRRMVPLVAIVNLAIKDGELTFNPFVGCVRDRDDSERRLPFDDDDMKAIRENLHKLDDKDKLLVRLLASSGLRRAEAFSIDQEQTEGGVRYFICGTKTEQSRRRVPFPADVLSYLPAKITKPLFTGRMDSAGKRIVAFLREIGIDDPAKAPMHSFRHRAADRLRAADCPIDIRHELLGHERKTVAAGYGVGSPVSKLKKWIDCIGF
jgi:integrase